MSWFTESNRWKHIVVGLSIGSLWVEMNKVYSDNAASIAKIMGVPVGSVKEEDMVRATHALAVDNLKDEDGVYSIRHYFRLGE